MRISHPFSKANLTLKTVNRVMLLVWLLLLAIAVIPLIPSDYFQSQFYARLVHYFWFNSTSMTLNRSSVCMSIHITRETPPGWEYSVAVTHGLNFLVFLFIFIAYGYMYIKIKSSSKASGSKTNKELAIARKMTLIVLTDFCCWFPINIMGKGLWDWCSVDHGLLSAIRVPCFEWCGNSGRDVFMGHCLHFAHQLCS